MSTSPKPGSLFRFGAPASPATRNNSGGSVSSTTLKFGGLGVKSPRAVEEVVEVVEEKPKQTKKATKKTKKAKLNPSTTIKTVGLLYKKNDEWFVPPRAQFSFNALNAVMSEKVEEKIEELQAQAEEDGYETLRFENTGESTVVPSKIGGANRGFLNIPH